MNERRESRRRNVPFVRSAVLEWDGRSHIVAVVDLSPEGAFLSTRLPIEAGQPLVLRVVLPGEGREVRISCHVVRRIDRYDPSSGRPAGIGVKFGELDPDVARRIDEFSQGGVAAAEPAPGDRFEYRVLDRTEVTVDELNRLGLDGWELASTLPLENATRLILVRKL